jgi:hypothetical protein
MATSGAIPLYLDKEGNGDNMVNRLLWNLMLGAPLVAMLAIQRRMM